jgi:UDP-3-O-[3-hydroxymyristoyl] N-acetylglucosamine deacetylase
MHGCRELVRATELLEGRGLHSGRRTSVQLLPAPPGSGVLFLRRDLHPVRPVPAILATARPGRRRTELVHDGVSVSTVEHVLAALGALRIYDARIELDGEEVPALDGSAAPFAAALLRASRHRAGDVTPWRVRQPIRRRMGDGTCALHPAAELCIDCRVRFASGAVGEQHLRWHHGDEALFLSRLAPARTFGFFDDAQSLSRAHLARGATLANVLVYDARAPLNQGGTRFRDEVVRHKVLDAVGDLALLGGPLCAHLKLERCSHVLLVGTLKLALEERALVQG